MRFMTRLQRGLLVAAAALLLVACGGPSATTSTGGPGAPTATTSSSSTVTASTSLCDLLSLGDVSAVVGGTDSSIVRNKTQAADGSMAVTCTYLPGAGGAHVGAEISYLFTSNGQAAFAANKADDASRGEAETTLSGVGDAAFWATSPTHRNTLQLTAQKGNVLLVMTLGGAGANGSTMVNGAIGLANKALPSL